MRLRWAPGSRGTAVAVGAVIGALLGATGAYAAFTATTAPVSATYASSHIFPTTETVPAFDLQDASAGGTEAFAGSSVAFGDGTMYTALNTYPTAYNAARYIQFSLSSPLPGGIPVSTLQLNVGLRDGRNGAGQQACFYAALYKDSTQALLSTYGSSASPIGCATSNTATTTFNTTLTGITTSDQANDIDVRLYIWTNTPARATVIDQTTVTGTTPYGSFTLYPDSTTDATGAATTTPWTLAAVDGTASTSAANFQTAFNAARYLRPVFDPSIPAGATVSGATLNLSYRPNTSTSTLCYYIAVYNGATLLATHGSTAAPLRCVTGTAYTTDAISLPEVNTVAIANATSVRVYFRSTPAGKAQVDEATLSVSYRLA